MRKLSNILSQLEDPARNCGSGCGPKNIRSTDTFRVRAINATDIIREARWSPSKLQVVEVAHTSSDGGEEPQHEHQAE